MSHETIPAIDDTLLKSLIQQIRPVIDYQEVGEPSTGTVSVRIQGEIRHYARRVDERKPRREEPDTPNEKN